MFTGLDWFVLRTFDSDHAKHNWADIVAEIHSVDPARAEAMLHSWPPEGGLPPLGAAWTFGLLGSRWEAVDASMLHLEERGLTLSSGDINSVAWKAAEDMLGEEISAERRLAFEEDLEEVEAG